MSRSGSVAAAMACLTLVPAELLAQISDRAQNTAQDAGVSGIWILANLSYAGMRAQDSPSGLWRVVAFIFGFPGTLLTFFVVSEGGERAYGVDLPRAARVARD
jgi:hypothetical protein